MDKVVILGRGLSGRAAAKLAVAAKLKFVLASDGDLEPPEIPSGSLVVLSPGIRPDSPLLGRARAAGCEIISELEFAARHFPGRYLAITGTNGKTTTTELTTWLLQHLGFPAVAAGNIGLPLSEIAAEVSEHKRPPETLPVIEVSSFQLEAVRDFSPEAAVLLNLGSDHLDRYPGGMAEYEAVKRRIFHGVAPANRIFGRSLPPEGVPRVVENCGTIFLDGLPLLEYGTMALKGAHNLENTLAALELAARVAPAAKFFEPEFLEALRRFSTGRHRLETVCQVNCIVAIDDSKATNPAAVIAALKAIAPEPRANIHLLAGGLDKAMDFTELRPGAPYLKHLYLYGQARSRIGAALSGLVPMTDFGTDFAAAVRAAAEAAQPGEVVLLSPACASMDLFKNYQERGERFAELIREVL